MFSVISDGWNDKSCSYQMLCRLIDCLNDQPTKQATNQPTNELID